MTGARLNSAGANRGTTAAGESPSMAARITLIMAVFDGPSVLLTGDDVVSLTDLPRSTTYRILDQLAQLNWLEREDTRYRLGWRALALGGDNGRDELRAVTAPLLHELYLRTRLVAHLSVLDGTDLVYLDKVGGRCASTIPTCVGGRVPAHWTAEGRAMLAMLAPDRLASLYPTRTTAGISLPRLQRDMFRIRARRGLAIDVGSGSRDSVVSMAVRFRGEESGLVASVSLRGHVPAAVIERASSDVVEAVSSVARALSPVGPRS